MNNNPIVIINSLIRGIECKTKDTYVLKEKIASTEVVDKIGKEILEKFPRESKSDKIIAKIKL